MKFAKGPNPNIGLAKYASAKGLGVTKRQQLAMRAAAKARAEVSYSERHMAPLHEPSKPDLEHSFETGPKGGRFYINSSGEKIYVK